MSYLDEVEDQLDLIKWSELDKETIQMILDLGDEDELLQD
jgi:hypothetical protein